MANKEMTRAQALTIAIDTIREYEGECEALTVLEKMHAQITKPRKRSDAPSKARILNESLAGKVYEAMQGYGEPVSTKWVCEHVNGIMTPQKATAVMRILLEDGRVTRSKEGKAVTYSIAE